MFLISLVKFCVDFKILHLVFKDLHGLAPQYICDFPTPFTASRPLRSSSQFLLTVPRSCFKAKSNLAFSVAASRLWDSLVLYIKSAPSMFKSSLKTIFVLFVLILPEGDIFICQFVCVLNTVCLFF